MIFEGKITLGVKVEADSLDEALQLLDDNAVDFQDKDERLKITSEDQWIYPISEGE